MTAQYNLTEVPEGFTWSGNEIPKIGARVKVNFNQFGEGTVTGYFVEHTYLGLQVLVDKQPQWHIDQGGKPEIHVFGAEIR